MGFRAIGRHYDRTRASVVAQPGHWPNGDAHDGARRRVNKGVLHASSTQGRSTPKHMAVTVASDDEDRQRIERQWAEYDVPIELHTVYSPYRELTRPIMRFIDELDSQHGDDIITVVIPEFVTSWGTQWLHNGSAFALKARLLQRPHTAVVSVPVHVHDGVVEDA